MRPLRLEMEGFGTFSQRTGVDFVGADFFALVGPTGAGKSTVMDAICFALYGRAPRWGQGIEYALAPSATTGKVQLVFAAADRVYVATRVVRRGGKGKVTTASAALERLGPEVDPVALGDVSGLIGTSLAGSAKGVTEQVERIVGLPFEQFTKCVLLPQGAFADFLHAGAAERRKILENLLGHAVYRDIQTAAGEEQRATEAVLSHIDSQLQQLTPVSDEDLASARLRIERLSELDASVRETVPRLEELAREASEADAVLKVVDEEHSLLTYIRKPGDVDSITDELAEAAQAVAAAKATVSDREQTEEQLRARLAGTDLGRIEQLLADHAQAAKYSESLDKGRPLTEEAQRRCEAAGRDLEMAKTSLKTAGMVRVRLLRVHGPTRKGRWSKTGLSCPVGRSPHTDTPTPMVGLLSCPPRDCHRCRWASPLSPLFTIFRSVPNQTTTWNGSWPGTGVNWRRPSSSAGRWGQTVASSAHMSFHCG